MTVVLEPRRSADWCFLIEALDYRLSGLIPLATRPEVKGREFYDRDAQSTVLPMFAPGDAARVRHGWEGIADVAVDPPVWKHGSTVASPLANETQEIGALKGELFRELASGTLPARGRRILKPLKTFRIEDVSPDLRVDCVPASSDYEPIPKEFWGLEGIFWPHCLAVGKSGMDWICYFHIQVDCQALLARFPQEAQRPIDGVSVMSGQLVLASSVDASPVGPNYSRGRRREYDWSKIVDEARRRLEAGKRYPSRTAFYGDMRVFCQNDLGYKTLPAESLMRAHLLELYERYHKRSGES